MIQLQVKYLKYMINQQDQPMQLQWCMTLIIVFVKIIKNAKIKLIEKWFKP